MIAGIPSVLRHCIGLLILIVCVTESIPGLQAQVVPQVGEVRKVSKVQLVLTGAQSMDEARIREQMSLREGEDYSDAKAEQDIRNLFATGAFEDVNIRAVEVPGGVNVIVQVIGKSAIGSITFVGNTSLNDSQLLKEIEVKAGDPVDESRLAVAQQKIRELYEKRGFSDVLVNHSTRQDERSGLTQVVFQIEEGAKGLINEIRFEGNTALKDSELRGVLKSKKKTWWRVFGKAGKLDNALIFEDVRAVELALQDKGYLNAKVVEVRREPVSKDKIDLVFVVEEGELHTVSEVDLDGVTIFTQEELAPGIVIEPGKIYSATVVKNDEKMIKDYYGSRGYADARVETSLLSGGPRMVKVVFRVTEGQKSYIQKINIAGNDITQDRVIRRELPFAPGEETNTVLIERGRNRLQQMDYFSLVDVRTVNTDVAGFKDVNVDVVEKSTGEVNFGAGFSSIDSLTGFLNLTQKNFDITNWPTFRGGGQRFNMNAMVGLRRRDFVMSLAEPWFMGQKLQLTTSLFYRSLFFLSDDFDQTEAGGSIGLRKPLGEHSYAELAYTLQNVTIDDISNDASDIIRAEEGDFLQSKLDFSVVHDTRSDFILPRSGHKFEVGAMTSGNFLGGDVDAYGLNAQGIQYFSLPGGGLEPILSFEGAVRTVDSWGSGDAGVPIFERLFLGGVNNVRGFRFREVGPKDDNGEPIGGGTSVFFSTELTCKIVKWARGAVFYDMGYVNTDSYDFSASDLNSNVGVGLRLFTPMGPMRIDFGIPLRSDRFNDSSGEFQFSMGYKY